MFSRKLSSAVVALTMGLAAISPALAAGSATSSTTATHKSAAATPGPQAKKELTMRQAILKAERQEHGTATNITATTEGSTTVYQIDVKKADGAIQRVAVNAQTGKLTPSSASSSQPMSQQHS